MKMYMVLKALNVKTLLAGLEMILGENRCFIDREKQTNKKHYWLILWCPWNFSWFCYVYGHYYTTQFYTNFN